MFAAESLHSVQHEDDRFTQLQQHLKPTHTLSGKNTVVSHTHTNTHTFSRSYDESSLQISLISLWSLLSDFLLTANHEASDQTLRSESTSGQRERRSEWRWRVIYWEILGFLELLKTETNWIHKNQMMMMIWLWCNNNTQKLTFMYSWVSLKHISPHN